jgi:CPA1 family monovalent cation:H+ antiporter
VPWREADEVEIGFFLVALAVVVLAGSALAGRLGFPAPLLLIAVGVVGAYVPGMPEVRLEPDVVLLGLLPPLLYAAAVQTSLVDFRANLRPILLLSVGLVVFTTFGIGALVHMLLPEVGWPAAFAIGAVVAPPDAVAATAIARRIGMPRRLVTILEGESLLNDASALVALRTALAAIGGGVSLVTTGGDFLRAAVGGAAVGFLVYFVVAKVRRRITDPQLDVSLSFVVPFAAYLVAEEIHSSGVIAVVVAGLLLGHKAAIIQTAPSRIAERMNWRSIAFLLENTVFLLIGLQAKWLLNDVADSAVAGSRIVLLCGLTLLGVIVLRFLWLFPATYLLLKHRPGQRPSPRNILVLGWAGMRGVVTLAAAFVIPTHTPYREVLLLIAFTVVAGTLFAQGLTLPWLVRRLGLPAPNAADDALARATLLQQASAAGFARLDELEPDDPHGVCELIRQRIDQRNFAAWERLGTVSEVEAPSELYARVRGEMIDAERARVLEIRSAGHVPSDIVSEVLAMLDIEESMLDVASAEQAEVRLSVTQRSVTGETCADLEAFPPVTTVDNPTCQACVDDGIQWVALRQCLVCGNVACCDSSPGQHAAAHFHETAHPVMQTAEPEENWRWCYVHHLTA